MLRQFKTQRFFSKFNNDLIKYLENFMAPERAQELQNCVDTSILLQKSNRKNWTKYNVGNYYS